MKKCINIIYVFVVAISLFGNAVARAGMPEWMNRYTPEEADKNLHIAVNDMISMLRGGGVYGNWSGELYGQLNIAFWRSNLDHEVIANLLSSLSAAKGILSNRHTSDGDDWSALVMLNEGLRRLFAEYQKTYPDLVKGQFPWVASFIKRR